MTPDEGKDQWLLYAAGALDAAEAAALRDRLERGSAEDAGLAAEADAVFAAIGLGADEVEVPASLKQRLMRRIDAETHRPAVSGPGWGVRLFRVMVPAAVAAGVTLVVTHAVLHRQIDAARRQSVAYRDETAAVMSALQVQQQQLDGISRKFAAQTQVVNVLQSPRVKLVRMTATKEQPNAVANLLWDEANHKWEIVATGMSPAVSGETYEVWFVTAAGAKIRAGLFDVGPTGTATVSIDVPADIGPLKLAAVTNEAAGGTESPKGNFQFTAPVE